MDKEMYYDVSWHPEVSNAEGLGEDLTLSAIKPIHSLTKLI